MRAISPAWMALSALAASMTSMEIWRTRASGVVWASAGAAHTAVATRLVASRAREVNRASSMEFL